jgi:hypothetical protein
MHLPTGMSIKTEGLSIKYPELEKHENRKIALIDSAGFETPVLVMDEKQEGNKNKLYQEKCRDKIITELFLQNYIVYNSDILIVVVDCLSFSEQKLLEKVKHEVKRLNRRIPLYIIHNLKTYTSIDQVKNYIKNTLKKSATFSLEEDEIINKKKTDGIITLKNSDSKFIFKFHEKEENKNNEYIFHLIYANEGSEAGNFYNQNTLEYLKMGYINVINLEPFDVLQSVKDRFKNISKEILEKNEKEKNFENQYGLLEKDSIIFDNSNKDVIKLIKPEVINLKNCLIDELGFQNLKSDGYEPSYNCYRKGNKLIINIEAPGDSYLKTEFQRNGAFTFIRIIGKKNKDMEPGPNENIFNSRKSGEFVLDIPLKYEYYWFKYQNPAIIKDNGVFKIIFELFV